MRTLILGWADILKGAKEGGGYNLVAKEHALNLAEENEVYYLKSGTTFSFLRFLGINSKPVIVRQKSYKGLKRYNLVDSYIRAPGLFNINYGSYTSSVQSDIIIKFIVKKGITRVFIHSFEGFPFDLIPKMKKEGVVVEIFCHDHYLICPRVNLLYKGKELCSGLLNCNECLKGDFAKNYEKVKFIERTPFRFILKKRVRKIEDKALIETNITNRKFIKNIAYPICRTSIDRVLYSLSYADKILSPSNFILQYLMRSGIVKDKLYLCKLGLPHLDRLKQLPVKARSGDKIVFCYRGTTRAQKGANLLFKALENLPQELCIKSRFIIYGIEKNEIDITFPGELDIDFFGPYKVNEIKDHEDYDIGILTHLWFENSPVVMLEYLAQGKGIISPRLGGVEDYINSETGYFYNTNYKELLKLLTSIINRELPVPKVNSSVVESFKVFIKELS